MFKSGENMSLRRTSSANVAAVTFSPVEKSPKFKTATPSLLGRWRSFRGKSSGPPSMNNHNGTTSVTLEDVYMDSFDESFADELSVKVCKDSIRMSLIENMKMLGSNANSLIDIENGKTTSDQVGTKYRAFSSKEKNIVFLWSAFVKRDDLLEPLYEVGASLVATLPNEGFTALHLAAFSGCVKSCKWLLVNGLEVNLVVDNLSPLHCAVLGNSLDCVKLLLRHGAKIGSTVLHCGVQANALDCLKHLLTESADFNAVDENGLTALHVAADRGMAKCLQTILAHCPKVDLNIQTRGRRSTPLHLASENGYFECVQYLINAGADVHAVNYKEQTALHLAAKAQSTECMEVLLAAGCPINGQDMDSRTPLHATLAKTLLAFNALEVLLRRGADVNLSDKYGYTPLHIAALNELSQCVDCLIMSGADVTARTSGGLSALSIIGRKTPGSINTICQKLDLSISMNDHETSSKEVELKLDFRYLLQNSSAGEVGFLKTLEAEGQKHLIEHPLCEAFLHLKWQKIRKFYFLRLFFCFVFVILLTVYVIAALAHECYNAAKNVTQNARTMCLNNSAIGGFLMARPAFIESIWHLLVLITIFESARKVMGIPGHRSMKHYFLQLMNVFEWFVIVSVFLVSYVWQGQTFDWQKHIGALAVLLAWTDFMIMVGQLPIFGTYVAMFTKVQAEFFKLLFAYSCLLIGFTVSFCVVFPSSDVFRNPIIGFIKVLVMMTGEVDFDMLGSGPGAGPEASLLLDFSAHITFVLFLLFVTVVLMNLLVGIAVHDIQGLHKTAGLSKLVRQTELIYFLELAICRGYVPRNVVRLLRQLALVSPQAYRVVLHVKPLNPREKRLPKEVLMAAFNLAKQKKTWSNSSCSWSATLRNTSDPCCRDEKNLFEEVRQLKEMVHIQNALISKLVNQSCSSLSKDNGSITS
nr:PREDICTED: transient receptor potential channel pyrexia [Bemisia tabaci]